jgi:hypothetical protein
MFIGDTVCLCSVRVNVLLREKKALINAGLKAPPAGHSRRATAKAISKLAQESAPNRLVDSPRWSGRRAVKRSWTVALRRAMFGAS